MSSRGAYGFRMGGKQWVVYNHHDSYYEDLGQMVANWATKYTPEEVKVVLPEVEIEEDFENADNLFFFLISKRMQDDSGFLENKLFCEYAYILNVDTKTLQVTDNGRGIDWDIPWDDKVAANFKAESFKIKKEYR